MAKVVVALAAMFVMVSPLLAADVDSTMLLYQAQEPGAGSYPSRILVTERYVRMDDGVDQGDYLVFDRKTHLISSVTHDDQTVFEIPEREITLPSPLKLELRTAEVALQGDAPKVAGKAPHHRELYVNDKLCYSVVAVPGLMDDAVAALREFRQVLAGEHAHTLPRIPADMQEPCDLALNTFHPEWQLQFGLPLQEWDGKGNRQVLMDYKEGFKVDEKLFSLPKGYQHYNSDQL
ncbi:MAG: hypothetical protein P8171_26445 [Candidatus Thiodiazotropha sp.]